MSPWRHHPNLSFVDTRYICEYWSFYCLLCKYTFHDRWMKGCQVSPFYKSNSWIIWIKSLWLKLSRLQPQISHNILNYLQFTVYFRAVKMDQIVKVLVPQCEVLSVITRTHTTEEPTLVFHPLSFTCMLWHTGDPLHTYTHIFKINKCE